MTAITTSPICPNFLSGWLQEAYDWLDHKMLESRWQLRRAIRVMNQVLSSLSLEQHPDKTFIGRTQRGFDFLGIQFTATGGDISQRREPCPTKRENCSALRARCIHSYNNIRRGQSTHRAVL